MVVLDRHVSVHNHKENVLIRWIIKIRNVHNVAPFYILSKRNGYYLYSGSGARSKQFQLCRNVMVWRACSATIMNVQYPSFTKLFL